MVHFRALSMTYSCMLGEEFHWRRGQWLHASTKYGEAKARIPIGLIHMNVETEMLRIVLQAVLCRRNMDNQANGSGQIAGIRNAMLQKITEHPMAAENYECKTPNEQHIEYRTTFWPYL